MNQNVYVDENGKEYVLDENGNRMPPMQVTNGKYVSGFWVYDDSQGHCALCGRLTCRGECFK